MDWDRSYALALTLAGVLVLYVLARTRRGEELAADLVEGITMAGKLIITPRGIRNNNPMNLRDFGIRWQGLDSPSSDAGGYARFVDPVKGLRAGMRDLLTDFRRDGQNTIRKLITEFAPREDSNDTAAYIAAVAKRLGIGADAHLDVPSRLIELARAIVAHENGAKWERHYSAEQYAQAAQEALA